MGSASAHERVRPDEREPRSAVAFSVYVSEMRRVRSAFVYVPNKARGPIVHERCDCAVCRLGDFLANARMCVCVWVDGGKNAGLRVEMLIFYDTERSESVSYTCAHMWLLSLSLWHTHASAENGVIGLYT